MHRVVHFLHGDIEQFRSLWYGATGGVPPAAPAGPPSPRPGAADGRVAVRPEPPPAGPVMVGPDPPSAATLRRRVTRSLDHPLGSASHGDVGAQLDRFEQVLLALCTQAVLDVLDERAEPAAPDVQVLYAGGHRLVLKLRPDLQRERTLRMTLQDVATPDLDAPGVYVDHRTALDGSIGRFDSVCLTLPRTFGTDVLGGVRDHLLVTLRTGYDVLERRAGAALAALQTSFDRALFGKVRDAVAALPDGDVWLLLVTRQRVCLAVSPDVVTRVLRQARALDDPVLAPVQQAYRTLVDPCPLNVTIRQALNSGQPVATRTGEEPAPRRDDLLRRIFVPGADVAVVPLAVGERMSILVACPGAAGDGVARALAPLRDTVVRLAEQY
ncbi:hypothetical protein AFB00_17325 [Pseudonocardia sp. HH130630-07]|nr:hypothetical protein AFB00_17325 [Pseudonocardia sp. HH130630-07]